MKNVVTLSAKFIGIAVLALVIVGFLASCKGKKSDELKPVAEQEEFTLDVLKPVLGEAREDASGILDVTGNANELIISYRYFDVDLKNYDDDMARELGPKIEALYAKFKTLDRVVFQLTTNNPLVPGEWKPYVNFSLNRKMVDELEWSGVLTADFFKNIIELKRFD
ncbi:MAG TPA: hypothetical protein VHP61_03295 [Acidobacteriota bacterium]|nr:hypothetical protein [Acidobacteriota bacterium]